MAIINCNIINLEMLVAIAICMHYCMHFRVKKGRSRGVNTKDLKIALIITYLCGCSYPISLHFKFDHVNMSSGSPLNHVEIICKGLALAVLNTLLSYYY